MTGSRVARNGAKRKSAGRPRRKRTKPRLAAKATPRAATPVADQTATIKVLNRELTEAREQQTATLEVLRVISRSPGDLEPILKVALENAMRLCHAKFGTLFLHRDGKFYPTTLVNAPPALADHVRKSEGQGFVPERGVGLHRILQTKSAVHILDDRLEPNPGPACRYGGARSLVAVPMVKEDELIGAFVIYRQEVRAFTDREIELVQSFADQAVIAIDNTRLLNELRHRTDDLTESLEQQTATSEVLKVISASPGELALVFRIMLENATHICAAEFGNLLLFDGESFRVAVLHGARQEWAALRQREPLIRPRPNEPLGRVVATKQVQHTADLRAEQGYVDRYPALVALADVAGARTLLLVPMLKEDQLIGVIGIYRQEVQPFTDKQIALVQNFAAQAVIAIENARLLGELRQRTDDLSESLEQQTATSEVLKVISSSPGELEAVFRTILENATTLCEARFGNFWICEGDNFRLAALHNAPAEYAEYRLSNPIIQPGPAHDLRRMAMTKQVVHMDDIGAELGPDIPLAKLAGARTVIAIPMIKDSQLIGGLGIYRQEVRPFTEKQISLMQNFAAQAVIAIENARLLNELRESLKRQTATSDVLSIISSSPGDLGPVFNTMLVNATRICDAKFGSLVLFEGNSYRRVGLYNAPATYVSGMAQNPVLPLSASLHLTRLVHCKQVLHVNDILAEDPDAGIAKLGGARTIIVVPIMKDGELMGAISVFRQEVRPFTDKQIELVQNFAAQAVIAIENARLLNELRESLDRQTATSEVLKVVSTSSGELAPVFGAMLANATRICEANFGIMTLHEDGWFKTVALHNAPPEFAEARRLEPRFRVTEGTPLSRTVQTGQPQQVIDLSVDETYLAGDPAMRTIVDRAGARSLIDIPMINDGEVVGVIGIYRQEVRPFTEKQIELVQNFAAQAVIAIENTRLLNELRESLQQQTATADVLKVISRSTFDLQAVLDTLTESAVKLCSAERANIWRPIGDGYKVMATFALSPEHEEMLRRLTVKPGRDTITGRTLLEGKTVHIPDVQADPNYRSPVLSIGVNRTVLGVPLLREAVPVGVLVVTRSTVRPFSPKEIELVETFANQAVIAIENVRLFDEIQDKSRQLAEASQHKSQFLASMSHELRTPLNAILGYTELMADGVYGDPPEKMNTVLKRVESNGRHLLGLINAVLDLSKIEAGQLSLDLADYSLQNVAQTVYNAVEPLAADKKLTFKADIQPDMPSGRGDERRLTQVLLNLVGNAIKFTDSGEVVIKAGASNGDFHLSVRDTGPGISAFDQAKLFQEFQQADNPKTRKKDGTGLGLAISRRIVEMHGGRIWIESQVGQGSIFLVTLPVQVLEQVQLPSN